jgi:hypothetical protein
MHRHLFDHIDVPKQNINILNGNAPDLVRLVVFSGDLLGLFWL